MTDDKKKNQGEKGGEATSEQEVEDQNVEDTTTSDLYGDMDEDTE